MSQLRQKIAALPRDDCDAWLLRLAQGKEAHLSVLFQCYLLAGQESLSTAIERRTVGELLALAEVEDERARKQLAAEAEARRIRETEEWFEKLGDFLQDSCQLTAQGECLHAVACFDLLYALIKDMEYGDEIVFGDEIGSWMIPGDEKQYLRIYMTAVAQTTTPDEFAAMVAPLARRDSYQSLAGEVYTTACRLANAAQKEKLDEEIKRFNIRTERRW